MSDPPMPLPPSKLRALLSQAWREHDVELALNLIRAGAPQAPPEPGVVPLCNAIRLLEPARALGMIPWRVDEVDSKRGDRRPLDYACELGAEFAGPELTIALLRAGADPNRLDGRGVSPLANASRHALLPTMRLLLDAGADPHLGSPLIALILGPHGAGFLDAAWLLLERGADPDLATPFGCTARACCRPQAAPLSNAAGRLSLQSLFVAFDERRALKTLACAEPQAASASPSRL